jgi:putative hydroxymethylpyrimidine transport system substrate-binding protein
MRVHWLFVVGLLVLLLAGCGGGDGSETTKAESGGTLESANTRTTAAAGKGSQSPKKIRSLWVAMDGWEGAETIGFVVAEKRGYFTKSKLQATTLSPITPALSIPDVLNGSDDVAVAHGPQVVLAKDKGAPIVIVGSLVPEPTAAMIWAKKSNIGGIADLRGKTIAIPGLSFQRDFLESVLARGGLTLDDVKVKSVGNDLVPALVDGKADAIFGGSGNLEGADLESREIQPVVTPVGNLGIPPYEELLLVATADRVEEDPESIDELVSAVARGAGLAIADPRNAAKMLDAAGESNPELSPKAFAASVKKTALFLSDDGQASPDRTQRLIDWMYEQGMIQSKLSATTLFASP